ncbi:Hypothetical predicted protein [Pelobates cultripes]|uniref:Uncharacterized protein n=1 Tax=Pelobates cultripes TaxID=61616 RepID=A0AAD1WM32_PELCU|nr:Hypothetical predicted protein [Pelobates cultripes]
MAHTADTASHAQQYDPLHHRPERGHRPAPAAGPARGLSDPHHAAREQPTRAQMEPGNNQTVCSPRRETGVTCYHHHLNHRTFDPNVLPTNKSTPTHCSPQLPIYLQGYHSQLHSDYLTPGTTRGHTRPPTRDSQSIAAHTGLKAAKSWVLFTSKTGL